MPLVQAGSPGFIVTWILASLLIGYMGRSCKLGSFGTFLVSFFFSPLVGIIVLLVAERKAK